MHEKASPTVRMNIENLKWVSRRHSGVAVAVYAATWAAGRRGPITHGETSQSSAVIPGWMAILPAGLDVQ